MTSSSSVARSTSLVWAFTALGSLLGLLRDQSIAGIFGASTGTDAFLIAWMLPEAAAPLFLEGALTYLLVPAFSRELARRGQLRALTDATAGLILLLLVAMTAIVLTLAPVFVALVAPGMAGEALTVDLVRLASPALLFLGMGGYLAAALRAHGIFGVPASIYIAWNAGILATIYLLHDALGVRSAALGLSVGALLIVGTLAPTYLRVVGLPRLALTGHRLIGSGLVMFLPLAGFSVFRHLQVFAERFFGSMLPAGGISHLNYASKVGQMAMLFSITIAAVAFPELARLARAERRSELAHKIEKNLVVTALLVLPAAGLLVSLATPVVAVLFQRGEFKATDTDVTAQVLAIYSLGVPAQALVSVCAMALFALPGRSRWPLGASACGLLVTVTVDALLYRHLGIYGLAVGNVVGIATTLGLLISVLPGIVGMAPLHRFGATAARIAVAAAGAGACAWFVGQRMGATPGALGTGMLTYLAAFLLLAAVLRVTELESAILALGIAARRSAAPRTGPVVLMYHAIEEPGQDPYHLCIEPALFEQQMHALAAHGYRGVTMASLVTAAKRGESTHNLVGLTFDDGYESVLRIVPVLNELGFNATVFVVTEQTENTWDAGPRRRLLDLAQVHRLAAAGFEIGSHGRRHLRLTEVSDEELEAEVFGSRRDLQAWLGRPVPGFCYPYGQLDHRAVAAVKRAGYAYGAAIAPGRLSGLHAIPRMYVGRGDRPLRLLVKLWSARARRRLASLR